MEEPLLILPLVGLVCGSRERAQISRDPSSGGSLATVLLSPACVGRMRPGQRYPSPLAALVLTDDALREGGWVRASLGRVGAAPLLAEKGALGTYAMPCALPGALLSPSPQSPPPQGTANPLARAAPAWQGPKHQARQPQGDPCPLPWTPHSPARSLPASDSVSRRPPGPLRAAGPAGKPVAFGGGHMQT